MDFRFQEEGIYTYVLSGADRSRNLEAGQDANKSINLATKLSYAHMITIAITFMTSFTLLLSTALWTKLT